MADCEHLANCGFFKKYDKTKELACKGFIAIYCHGDKQSECLRKKHKKETGKPPSDDMMPNGLMVH